MNEMIKYQAIRHRYLNSYLAELNHLFTIDITEGNLQSLEFTQRHIEQIHQQNRALLYKECLSFSQREHIRQILLDNNFSEESPCYFWSLLSDSCGLLAVPSVKHFNWTFNYDIDENGIFVFYDASFNKEVKIDFYDEGDDRKIKIELWKLE